MTSPSGVLGAQFNMGRMPSMGLGNLDSMELPDTVRDDSNAEGCRGGFFQQLSMLDIFEVVADLHVEHQPPHPCQSFPSKLRNHLGNGLKTYACCWQAGPLDANAAAAMLHDMPADGRRSGASNTPSTSAGPPASSAPPQASSGSGENDGGRGSAKGENNTASAMQVHIVAM